MTPLDVAKTQIGVREDRGNRGVPYKLYAITGEDCLPWCARFVRWCFTQAGIKLPGNRYLQASVAYLLAEFQHLNAMISEKEAPEPGDLLILRDRGASDPGAGHHIGIVESCDAITVNSIDGNWGDAVKRVSRPRALASIAGYARWPIRPTA